MNRKLERFGVVFTFVVLTTRCAGSVDSGSQTHWMAPCAADAACGEGLGCVCGICTRTCSSGSDCAALGRGPVCVTRTSAAHTSLCGGAENFSVCLPACEGGCRSNEQCVDGACVPSSAIHPDSGAGGTGGSSSEGGQEASTGGASTGGSPSDGSVCTHWQTLIYPNPGCGETPICAGPGFDACLATACGCDGVTLTGCGDWRKPWVSLGPCPETVCISYFGDASSPDGGDAAPSDGSPVGPGCWPYTGSCSIDYALRCNCLVLEYPGCTCTEITGNHVELRCP